MSASIKKQNKLMKLVDENENFEFLPNGKVNTIGNIIYFNTFC